MIACCFCFTEMPGVNDTERAMDAINTGWDNRNGDWVCADCIIEEGKL